MSDSIVDVHIMSIIHITAHYPFMNSFRNTVTVVMLFFVLVVIMFHSYTGVYVGHMTLM